MCTLSIVSSLPQVPKCLQLVCTLWSPRAFVVSFKLETDATLLEPKARRAIRKYGVDLVVANQLDKRYDEVVLFTETDMDVIRREGTDPIEVPLVAQVARRHRQYRTKRQPST